MKSFRKIFGCNNGRLWYEAGIAVDKDLYSTPFSLSAIVTTMMLFHRVSIARRVGALLCTVYAGWESAVGEGGIEQSD